MSTTMTFIDTSLPKHWIRICEDGESWFFYCQKSSTSTFTKPDQFNEERLRADHKRRVEMERKRELTIFQLEQKEAALIKELQDTQARLAVLYSEDEWVEEE